MNLELMKTLTTLNVSSLYKILLKFLRNKGYTNIKKGQTFIMAEGEIPICLIAHMDTVFNHIQSKENFIYDKEKHILWGLSGSGFDDRAGIAGIIELLERGHRPHIIFTDKEEVGGIGANDLIERYTKCPFKHCKMLIELDRANEKDAVFYSCDNKEFESYIESFGFITDWGTFSDISIIAPVWKIAAVNLSIGYCYEHTPNELLHTDWFDATIDRVEEILYNIDKAKKYKYIPITVEHFMRPRFILNNNECLICGAKLNKKNRRDVYDEEFPYSVCTSCYNQYYTSDEAPFDFS